MLFFHTSRYLCACGDTATDPQTKLPTAMTAPNLHPLPDLYFCPKCHHMQCNSCSIVSVEAKYCPNCMTDYTENAGTTRCTKNCFECPKCTSPLSVSAKDETLHGIPGKVFSFACVFCAYTYSTCVVTRPAALASIVRAEGPRQFQKLSEKLTQKFKVEQLKGKSQPSKIPLTPGVLSRMRAMNVKEPSSTSFSDIDMLTHKISSSAPIDIDVEGDFEETPTMELPLSKHLVAKHKYACSACHTGLVVPVADAKLMKILQKQFAVDVVPTMTAKMCEDFVVGGDTSCVLNVINPLASSINVTVSIVATVPAHFAHVTTTVSFPTTHFSVQGRREKGSMVESVPTSYLTSATKQARAEQLIRAGRRERRDTEEIEVGPNWVAVPFSVSVEQRPETVQIPFYVTVESRMPESWKGSGKRGLRYGFWVVCDLLK